MKPIVPSINYHLTKACNMRCKFCFATFNDLGMVKHDIVRAKRIIDEIANCGFEKITFAGGEPTIVKELAEILKHAKSSGLVTTIVTNGGKLADEKYLDTITPHLDWVALSIDALDPEINLISGRAINGKIALSDSFYLEVIETLKTRKIKLKINTVVSAYNWNTQMNLFIASAKPDRWKILQALKIDGQNDQFQDEFDLTDTQFNTFLNNHQSVLSLFPNAVEPIDLIKGSYLMISPDGKLYDNTGSSYSYSEDIVKIGLSKALEQINFDRKKFIARGGIYSWNSNK